MSTSNPAHSGNVVTDAPEDEIIENLTEKTLRVETVGSHDPIMQVGDGATFYNNIYDADDNVVGDTVGIVIATGRNPSDGHIITEYTEAINLFGGTLKSHGTVDRIAVLSGAVMHLDVVGTSGRFLGMQGIRECQILPPYPPSADSRVTVKITLSK
jgi:Allene oxide cyclase barrel like domain